MNKEKHLILLEEYKRGFSEVEELVHGFKGITNGSQKAFLENREAMLEKQLHQINEERDEIYEDIKRVLVKVNSRLLALKDLEGYISGEILKCKITERVIEEEGGETNEDKQTEYICGEGKDKASGVEHDPEGAGQ
ncbi:MAG: hypothetical protein JJT76_13015 [Clostridiaceae bacterium]|nr:hypothetical protein [Clostridiaceae bacterium]